MASIGQTRRAWFIVYPLPANYVPRQRERTEPRAVELELVCVSRLHSAWLVVDPISAVPELVDQRDSHWLFKPLDETGGCTTEAQAWSAWMLQIEHQIKIETDGNERRLRHMQELSAHARAHWIAAQHADR